MLQRSTTLVSTRGSIQSFTAGAILVIVDLAAGVALIQQMLRIRTTEFAAVTASGTKQSK
ncbi:hypothetical protein BH686_03255 [Rhodococcus erythropolis]|nr:hypothetical protein BH686_03255 [Rhodococcus erythropolis]